MTRWIIGSSLKFRHLVIPIAVALMVLGIAQLRNAPVDVLPEYTLPYVEVQTESLGLSAAEVEQLITVPMEQDLLNGVRGVETIRSDSVPGLSSIVLVFERGTDILQARQLVQERLTQAHALPNVSKPPQMLQPVSSTSRVMMIGLSTRKLTPIELSVLARWTIRPRLMGLPGVANVAIWGQRERQLQVQVDPERLRAQGVTLSQVIRTTGNAQLVSPLTFLDASTPGTGGFIDGPNQRLGVRHILPFGTPSDLAQVPIDGASRAGSRLGDVATVVEDHQPLIGDAVVNGGHGLLLVVEKLPGANTLEVTRELDRALDDMRPGLSGVRIDASVFRPATFIQQAIGHLALVLIIAGALAVLALAAFLMRWRAVFVSAVAIPLSLLTALVVLDLTGATINALVVAGLVVALGVVVDDAVGDVQNIARRLHEQRAAGPGSAAQTVLEASLEMRGALGYATLIVLLVMVPVFFTGGLTGAFVHPMALSYGLAVLASMAVALIVTPALSLMVLGRSPRRLPGSGLVQWLGNGHQRVLARGMRTPRPALLTLVVLALAGIAALPLLEKSLRPSFKDRELLVHWDATPSISLPEMERITARAGAELRAIPGVQDAGGHVGRAVTSDQAVGTGSGETWLTIDRSADYDATLSSIRRVVGGYPGLRGTVLTYESDRTQGVLTKADHAIVVRVYGQELGTLRRKAQEMRQVLSHVAGLRDLRVQSPPMQPTLLIEADLAAARRHGIKPGDIRRAAGTLVSGLEVGSFFEEQKVFQVVVRGAPATRHSLTSVRDLLIDTPGGGHVRLGDVAHVRIEADPVDIRHEGVSRYMDVRAAVAGRDEDAVRADVTRRLDDVSFPLEYHAELLKPSEDVQAPRFRFLSLVIAADIGIFLLLQAAFGSWRLASLLFFTLPLALVGGLLVVVIGGGRLSLGAAVGLLAVLGIAARSGIVLIRRFQELERDGESLGPALVARGVRDRFAPVITSATVIAAAMSAFVVVGDVAGNEISHSTAAVVLGGLVTSTLLTLFVVPAMYLHFGSGVRAGRPRRAVRPPAAAAARKGS